MYGGRIVEAGPAREIYARPRHPYTIGLMASIPRLDQEAGQRLVPIEGQPPNLAQLPPGCAFAPRCQRAADVCRRERPPLVQASPGHLSACHFHAQLHA
jgi:oligopeptide transport system ATP-binding protein